MPYKDPVKKRAAALRSYYKHHESNKAKARHRRRVTYAANPEKGRAEAQQWRTNNPKKAREVQRKSRKKYAAKYTLYNQTYKAQHREALLAKQAAKRKANPEAARARDQKDNKRRKKKVHIWGIAYRARKKALRAQMSAAQLYPLIQKSRDYQRLYQSARRAKKRALPASFTKAQEQFMRQYWNFACAVCGREEGFEWFLALDHWIPITSSVCPGTIATNMLPLCHGIGGCNNLKLNHDGPTWLRERYGSRKANKILTVIETYFALVATMTVPLLTDACDSA